MNRNIARWLAMSSLFSMSLASPEIAAAVRQTGADAVSTLTSAISVHSSRNPRNFVAVVRAAKEFGRHYKQPSTPSYLP